MKRSIILTFAAFLIAAPAAFSQSEDATTQLVRSALEKQKSRPYWIHLRSISFGYVPYVFDVKTDIVKFDGNGNPKRLGFDCGLSAKATGVFVPVEGTLLYTQLEFCGRPVDSKPVQVTRRSESEKEKIHLEEEKQRKERARFWDEFLKAFRFQIVEHHVSRERATTVLSFTPNPAYRPGGAVDTKYLPKIRGQIWIDDADNELAHIEMEFFENVTAGLGILGKVSQGTSYSLDLAKQIDDQWLPAKAETVLKMRALLVMKTDQKYTYEYGNYRKFTTDVVVKSPER